MKKILVLLAAAGLIVGLAACQKTPKSAPHNEQKTAQQQLNNFLVTQPVPTFSYSQLRQNLIELETAQAKTTQTTSFFFNQGVPDPIQSCPSIGFPIAADTQLTNPQQIVNAYDNGVSSAVIGNIDPTGVYTGQTTGTYVICVNAAGQGYAVYWEGFVEAVSGAAAWSAATHSVTPVNNPTAHFSTAGQG